MKEILAYEYLRKEQVPKKYIENYRRNNPEHANWPDADINNWILKVLGFFRLKLYFMTMPSSETEDEVNIEKLSRLRAKAYEIYTEKCSVIFNNIELDQTLLELTSGDERAVAIIEKCTIQFNEGCEKFNTHLYKNLRTEEYNRLRSEDYIPAIEDLSFYNTFRYDLKYSREIKSTFQKPIRKKLTRFVSDTANYLNHENQSVQPYQRNQTKTNSLEKALLKQNNTSTNEIPTFDNLFQVPYEKHIDRFVEILREVTPELINALGQWTGAKNAARIYVNALIGNGIIRKVPHRDLYAALGNKFPELGESFMKNPKKSTRADEDYSDMYERIAILKSDIKTEPG